MTLKEIVLTHNLRALENLAIRLSYSALMDKAKREGVNLDELEEMLVEIS